MITETRSGNCSQFSVEMVANSQTGGCIKNCGVERKQMCSLSPQILSPRLIFDGGSVSFQPRTSAMLITYFPSAATIRRNAQFS